MVLLHCHVQRLCPRKDVDPPGTCAYAKGEYAVHEIDGESNKVCTFLEEHCLRSEWKRLLVYKSYAINMSNLTTLSCCEP